MNLLIFDSWEGEYILILGKVCVQDRGSKFNLLSFGDLQQGLTVKVVAQDSKVPSSNPARSNIILFEDYIRLYELHNISHFPI